MVNRSSLTKRLLIGLLRPRPLIRLRFRSGRATAPLPRRDVALVDEKPEQLQIRRVVGAVDCLPRSRRPRRRLQPCCEVHPGESGSAYPVESESVSDKIAADGPLMLCDKLKEAASSPRPGALASNHATSR
jgi:hypothetical protein